MTYVHSIFSKIGGLFALLHSAGAVSEAVTGGRKPADSDLARLGIHPAGFHAIGRA